MSEGQEYWTGLLGWMKGVLLETKSGMMWELLGSGQGRGSHVGRSVYSSFPRRGTCMLLDH